MLGRVLYVICTYAVIAFACGFNDASHFGRVFAARMHMTPSRWRQQR